MSKKTELILYGLTVVYCFIISGAGMGDTSHVGSFLAQRALFYIAQAVLLVIAAIRCRRLFSRYDEDYVRMTQKIFDAVECCFVMIAIVSVFGIVEIIPIFVFLPGRIFDGAANGLLALLLLTVLTFVFYNIVTSRFHTVKKQKWKIKSSQSENPDSFFAFIHSADEKRNKSAEKNFAPLFDDLVPDEEDFRRHLQQISVINPTAEPNQLWECPRCGAVNSMNSLQCDFCGADRSK